MLLMVIWCLCSTLVLAKKSNFVVIQERVEIESYNPEIITPTAGVFKVNRTLNALNITFTVNKDLNNETAKIYVQSYMWLSNEYRSAIIQFSMRICEIVFYEYFDLQRLFHEYTHPRPICPFKKGVHYTMSGWVPDEKKFPRYIPEGRYKALLHFVYDENTPMVDVAWYLQILYKI